MLLVLGALVLLPGLGSAGRLTYHEAIWAQVAREMIASGDILIPTLDGRPWLEKPPLPIWLMAGAGALAGGVTEASARIPSAIAAALLALGMATFAARRFGASIGQLSGAVQVTSAWVVMRGRLAEADVLLAALVVWSVVAFDRLRTDGPHRNAWRWAFFALMGTSSLVKGIGFGAVLVVAMIILTLAWDRDRPALKALAHPGGWIMAAVLAIVWPVFVVVRYPSAFGLWAMHVADRLTPRSEHFVGEPWWLYTSSLFWQTLPWTPLAVVAMWPSLRRAIAQREGGDRLLWAWAVGPAVLVSLASARNAHYLIYALPPWSIWTAFGLARLGDRLRWQRAFTPHRLRFATCAGLSIVGLAYALGYAYLGPWFDRRGVEWGFYEVAGRSLPPGEPLALLYPTDYHRYPTPFGPVPHDLAVRLFYLNRPACWRIGLAALAKHPPAAPPTPFAVIARTQDLPALRGLGQVELIAQEPATPRTDRAFALFQVRPFSAENGQDLATEITENIETIQGHKRTKN
jgi:4-amino-4-deoxy-L-arabinose transferase-like glycosyltransferase